MQQLELIPWIEKKLDMSDVGHGAVYPQKLTMEQWLSSHFAKQIELSWTHNRSTIISWREYPDRLRLRLHEIFAEAPQTVVSALAAYMLDKDKGAAKLLDQFIREHHKATTGPSACEPQGRVHNLLNIWQTLNDKFFHNSCKTTITWAQEAPRRRRRSIQLGLFLKEQNVIRIHPCLDQIFVPQYYVSWIVFHEMLHEVMGIEMQHTGRRSMHPKEFTIIEQTYPDYLRCREWEKKNIMRLLAYKPTRVG